MLGQVKLPVAPKAHFMVNECLFLFANPMILRDFGMKNSNSPSLKNVAVNIAAFLDYIVQERLAQTAYEEAGK